MRGRVALLALLLAGAPSCGHRDHANPFDPENPTTKGKPIGFVALAGNGDVTLEWQAVTNANAIGYQILRRFDQDPSFHPLTGVLSASTTRFLDPGLANGNTLHYRLYYVFPDGLSGSPSEDLATPGPLVPWATDLGAKRLLRLTPDARHVAFQDAHFSGPSHVAVDQATGVVWTSDTFDGSVVILDPATGARTVIPGFTNPLGLAVEPATHDAWICDSGLNALIHRTATGAPATPAAIGALDDPLDVAVDPGDGSIWVCESGGRAVRRFTAAGAPDGGYLGIEATRIATDSLTGEAWVTSFSGRSLLRFSRAVVALDTIGGLQGPLGVAVDGVRRRVWVADFFAGRVIAYRMDGSLEFAVSGLPQPREVAVDPVSGEAWATISGLGAVARISASGTVLGKTFGLVNPYGIALDYGSRPILPPGGARAAPPGKSR
jgi:DNA-binding beta-propeller fold protein YncE